MLQIKDVVNVVINRETTSKTVRDLQTIAVLSKHTRFNDAYRKYSSTTEMLDDGFITTDFAYVSVQRILSQNPQVQYVVVGKIVPDNGAVDYTKAIANLQASTNEWFFLIADAEYTADKIAIAQYMETQTGMYVFSSSDVDVLNNASTNDIFSKLKALNLMHSFGMFVRDINTISPESAWVGRFASSVIGSNTWIHKALTTLVAENLTRTEMVTLQSKNAHFYTKVGQDSSIEGNANVVGGEKLHVILGAIWLEVRLSERYWNLFYTKDRINYTNGGIELFKAELVNVLNEAVSYNILTDDDSFSIQVPDANKLTPQERNSGYLRKITFRARLAGAILFVNAVEGTVYS